MTTRVTVDAHAGWDVLVVGLLGEAGGAKTVSSYVVPAGDVRDFYIHSGFRLIHIEELHKAANCGI